MAFKSKFLSESAYNDKPNWIPKVDKEDEISHRGWKVYVAQVVSSKGTNSAAKEGDWIWSAYGESGTAKSKQSAITNAKRLIDDLIKSNENNEVSDDSVNFDNGSLVSIWALINRKINAKPVKDQASLLSDLSIYLVNEIKEMPSGESKLRKILKDFKDEKL